MRGNDITWTGSDNARNRSTGRGSSRLSGIRSGRRSGSVRRGTEWSGRARTTTDDGPPDKAGTVSDQQSWVNSVFVIAYNYFIHTCSTLTVCLLYS